MAEQSSRLAVIIDSSGAQKNADSLATSLAKLTQAGEKAETATENLSGATKDYNSWMKQGPRLVDDVTKSTQAATKATNDEAKALGSLLDKINPINAALNRLDDQQQALSKFKSKGMLDEETFTEYSDRIDQARSKLTGFSEALTKTGDTSRHAAHNMAMIPSQLSWMVTSIASGQSPIMALVQQGSMLSGMMGGLGPTIKAVGTYLAGLVNPLTIAGAAVAVLGLAYYQGEQEQEAFKKSLILTGNQVGKTADQLTDMADTVSAATGATQGQASSVIAQAVSTGTIAGDSLQKVSAAIVSMSDATGQATDSLVADFSNIAADPVAAITKLNDQYHFLTLATYNQIKALQDEGNQQGAAKVANDAYANALTQRANEIKNSLGTLETIWNSVGEAAKGAWDSMLDIGRGQTLQQQIANVQKQIADIQGNVKPGMFGLGGIGDGGVQDKHLASLKAQLSFLQSQASTQDVLNGFIDKHNQAQQAGIKAQEYIDNLQEQSLSNAEKRTKEQNLLTEALKKTRAAGTSISAAEEAQLRQDIDNKYKDPAQPKQRHEKAYTEDAGTRLLEQLNQQHAVMVSQLDTTDKLSTAQQSLVKWEQQLANLKSKSTLTADQKSLLANQDKITALYQQNAALEHQQQLQKQVTQLSGYQSNINKDIGNRQSQYGTEELSASGSISAYQQGILTQRTTLEQQLNDKVIQLRQQRTSATTTIDRETIDKEISMQQAANDQMLSDYDKHTQSMSAIRGSWSNGADKAWQEYADSASNASGMTQTLFSDAFSSMEDSIATFTTTGKLSFKGFANSVIGDISRIAARMAISGIASSIIGGLSGMFTGGGGVKASSGSSFSSGAYNNLSLNAKGGVYDSPSLSAYSNQVHSSPKLFAFAKGAGVFGEAGPEAIMPLTRGKDGSLGVRAVGGQSAAGGGIHLGGIIVNVNGQGQASANNSGTDGQGIAKQIQAAVVNIINEQATKQGTPLWRAIKGK
ncbi:MULTISPECIES: phage tail tape measure protein [unclassified Tatumella]|nr:MULTISPECIES: phage tail tape measure protein [unclassified Tatumella]MBS0855993.1 phage tail tape measure protein [Tatumella sp. JGM16]MBS0912972.1 phage tail tape measure protein [Tatumella sp. JGM91]